jgi:glycosyltransferase involved in cell wall biosynthesis
VRALIVMPVATQRGGTEVQLQQLVEQRAESRIEPTVAFLRGGPMVEWCGHNGVRAVRVDAGRLRQPRMVGRTARSLAAVAKRERCEVVIGWMSKGQVYGGLAAIGAGIPSVWLQAGVPARLDATDRLATLLPTQLVVTVSRNVDRGQRRLRPRRPTEIVYPAVDTSRFDARRIGDARDVRRRLGLPEDGPIFGSVGRLNRWKGFHVLLDAVPRVLARHPSATFVLVGGPHEHELGYADELRAQAARLRLDGRVRLVGQQPNPEDWMHAMDVFVHTSDNEPFGMVVIEAMALGKPVVAGAGGGPTEIVTPGVDGLLAPFGDHPALARQIVRLLDDDALRARVGRAATRRAGDFAIERFARSFGAAVARAVGRD